MPKQEIDGEYQIKYLRDAFEGKMPSDAEAIQVPNAEVPQAEVQSVPVEEPAEVAVVRDEEAENYVPGALEVPAADQVPVQEPDSHLPPILNPQQQLANNLMSDKVSDAEEDPAPVPGQEHVEISDDDVPDEEQAR